MCSSAQEINWWWFFFQITSKTNARIKTKCFAIFTLTCQVNLERNWVIALPANIGTAIILMTTLYVNAHLVKCFETKEYYDPFSIRCLINLNAWQTPFTIYWLCSYWAPPSSSNSIATRHQFKIRELVPWLVNHIDWMVRPIRLQVLHKHMYE